MEWPAAELAWELEICSALDESGDAIYGTEFAAIWIGDLPFWSCRFGLAPKLSRVLIAAA